MPTIDDRFASVAMTLRCEWFDSPLFRRSNATTMNDAYLRLFAIRRRLSIVSYSRSLIRRQVLDGARDVNAMCTGADVGAVRSN